MMIRKLKLLILLALTGIVMISTCSCGCRAKDESDTPSDSSAVSVDQSEKLNDDAQQTPPNQLDSSEQTSPQPDLQEPCPGGSDTSDGGAGGTGGTEGTGGSSDKIPNTVIVIIEDDQVFINDVEYKNGDELKNYIESVNNDSRVFKLFEDRAIQATHDWVLEVFQELHVEVMVVPNS